MNSVIKKLWLEALRSGKYRQTEGKLKEATYSGENEAFCCLGVLCDLHSQDKGVDRVWGLPGSDDQSAMGWYDDNEGELPDSVMDWAELVNPNPKTNEEVVMNGRNQAATLAYLNDHGMDFAKIADVIERDF